MASSESSDQPSRESLEELCVRFESQLRSDGSADAAEYLKMVRDELHLRLLKRLFQIEAQRVSKEIRGNRERYYLARLPQYSELIRTHFGESVDEQTRDFDEKNRSDNVDETRAFDQGSSLLLDGSGSIGNYSLIKPIGEGGMGTVWLAEQTKPVQRKVALKIIKCGMDSKDVIARFDAERQALAMMDHPSIARILDAGQTDEGQPYFAMELVRGKPLTEYCDSLRLPLKERLKLFRQVCDAVQHAHQKGIIHRDLKPGNILVTEYDGNPVAKVIDFGLAKAMGETQRLTDMTLQTGFGRVLGTLRYMSPEQAGMDLIDVDTRSDIYALGVILFELLTGSTPLDNDTIKDQALLKVLELIRERESPRPSSRLSDVDQDHLHAISRLRKTDPKKLGTVLAGDLDWVVMKALEKDRRRRYESASGFSMDIQRFLNEEPVEARPPSINYRVKKFVVKNRGFVFATSLVLALLALSVVSIGIFAVQSSYDARRARKAESLAESRLKDATQARQLAESNEKSAIEQSQLAMSTLTAVFHQIDDSLAGLPGAGGLRQRLLSVSLEKLKLISSAYISQSRIDRNSVVGMQNLGKAVLQFGVMEDSGQLTDSEQNESVLQLAESFLLESNRVAKVMLENNPSDLQLHFDAFNAAMELGNLYDRTGQFLKALEQYKASASQSAAMMKLDATHEFSRTAHALSNSNLAKSLERNGDAEEAVRRLEDAIESFSLLDPNDTENRHDLFVCHVRLGEIKLRQGNSADALKNYNSSVECARKLVLLNQNNRKWLSVLASGLSEASSAHFRIGGFKKGLEQLEESRQLYKRLYGEDPEDNMALSGLANVSGKLGSAYIQRFDFASAEPHALESVKLIEDLLQRLPDDLSVQRRLVIALSFLADVQASNDTRQSALENLKRAVEVAERLEDLQPDHLQRLDDLSTVYSKLSTFHLDGEEPSKALDWCKKSMKVAKQILDARPEDWSVRLNFARCHLDLGNTLFDLGELKDSLNAYLKFESMMQALQEDDPENIQLVVELVVGQVQLGGLHSQMANQEKACVTYQKALDSLVDLDNRGKLDPQLNVFLETIPKLMKEAREQLQ